MSVKPLEKSVDIFFKFREQLLHLDEEDKENGSRLSRGEGELNHLTAPRDDMHFTDPNLDDDDDY